MLKSKVWLPIIFILILFTGCNNLDKTAQKLQDEITTPKATVDKQLILEGDNVNFVADSSEELSKYEWFNENGKLLSTDKSFNRVFDTQGDYKTILKITDKSGKTIILCTLFSRPVNQIF